MRVVGYCEVCRKIKYVVVNFARPPVNGGVMVGRCGCDEQPNLTPRERRRGR